jgi:hypothetical protein
MAIFLFFVSEDLFDLTLDGLVWPPIGHWIFYARKLGSSISSKKFHFLKLILAYVKGIVDHVAIEFSWPVRLRGAD